MQSPEVCWCLLNRQQVLNPDAKAIVLIIARLIAAHHANLRIHHSQQHNT